MNIRDQGGAVTQPTSLGDRGGATVGRWFLPASTKGLASDPGAASDIEFWLQKQRFLSILAETLRALHGQFVASRDGQIVDHDSDLNALTIRFFARFGNVPVYMTKIGDEEEEFRVDTPFLE